MPSSARSRGPFPLTSTSPTGPAGQGPGPGGQGASCASCASCASGASDGRPPRARGPRRPCTWAACARGPCEMSPLVRARGTEKWEETDTGCTQAKESKGQGRGRGKERERERD